MSCCFLVVGNGGLRSDEAATDEDVGIPVVVVEATAVVIAASTATIVGADSNVVILDGIVIVIWFFPVVCSGLFIMSYESTTIVED